MAEIGERKVYLESVPPAEALQRLLGALTKAGWQAEVEQAPTERAQGRVTVGPVHAAISSPHYHAAAMDGVAVCARDTFGAGETAPLRVELGRKAHWVDTGDRLPAGCDAVIMVEHLNITRDAAGRQQVELLAPAAPWQHVRTIGEDIVATEMIVPANHCLQPQDIGALLAAGVLEVAVRRPPVVTFIPTGTELVQPTDRPGPGELIEFNSRVVLGLVQQWGGVGRRHEIVRDDRDLLRQTVAAAVQQSDVVVINAGSAAGSEDFTAAVIGELGRVLVHGAAIKPGKPVILGVVDGKPVLGLPGYPVSTYLTADLFLRPLIYHLQGLRRPERPVIDAALARRLTSPMGVDEYVRVKLGRVGERVVATPISRGAGVITSLVRADGILTVPADREGIEEGSAVCVQLLRPLDAVEDTVVVSGSHDITIDLLGSLLGRLHPGHRVAAAHVGSLGGIMALRRGEAHMAGVHLLDPATGAYNVPYVRRYLGQRAVLVRLCRRQQGLMVARGNPKGITGFADLSRPDVSMINRQRGAGTRVLLDYHLEQAGIDPSSVRGYDRAEYTHLAVAAAVAGGSADAGLGILAAAAALDLDFVAVTEEQYDLLIPAEHYTHPGVQRVLALLGHPDFHQAVAGLGGYDTSDAGRADWIEV